MPSTAEHECSEFLSAYATGQKDFSGWSIRGGVLVKEKFEGCCFDGAQFREIVGAWSAFDNSSLEEAKFSNCLFFGFSFVSSSLRGGSFARSAMDRSDFTRTMLADSTLSDCSLRWSCFLGADLSNCRFTRTNLGGSLFGRTLVTAKTLLFGPKFDDCVVALPHRISGSEVTELHGLASIASALANARPVAPGSDSGPQSAVYAADSPPRPEPAEFRALCASIPGIVDFLERGGVSGDLLVPLCAATAHWASIPRISVFLSYATEDQGFAEELAGVLKATGLDVWFAPRSMRGGQKLYEQLVREIDHRDHIVFLASTAALASRWVQTELRRAFAGTGGATPRRVIPVLLATEDEWRSWHLIDTDSGRDLAAELRSGRWYSFTGQQQSDDRRSTLDDLIAELMSSGQGSAVAEPGSM